MQSHWYAFIARCSDGSLYVAAAADPYAALDAANAGECGPWLKSRLPVSLGFAEEFMTEDAAVRGVAALKRLPRARKEELIRSPLG